MNQETIKVSEPRVFMMDLLAIVPYYTAYLSKALLAEGSDLTVGTITYYLDKDCFTSRGIRPDPGLLNIVGGLQLPRVARRVLKLLEGVVNLAALVVRFSFSMPEIVHVQYLPMLRWPVPLDRWFVSFCQWRGASIVLTVHDLLPHDTATQYEAIFRRLYASVDHMICHSEHIRSRLGEEFQVGGEKISVIPHGPFFYDLPQTDRSATNTAFEVDPECCLVLWQGIIFPYKGIDLLLDAWQRVEARDVNAVLVIAGTGAPELLEQIQAQVLQLGLKRVKLHFRFISTEELVGLYRAADVVVYPYRAITTSGALATGLALGKTIVASDLPVFRELLLDGENALLVNPEDVDALGGALLEMVEHPERRASFASQVRAMRFGDESWLAIARATRDVYAETLKKQGRA